MRIQLWLLTAAFWIAFPNIFSAQVTAGQQQLLIYLDCPYCDINFIKQEIPFVNYTVDPLRAQVHVLVRQQRLGSGGDLFQYEFIGRQEFEDDHFSLEFTAEPVLTGIERSERHVKILLRGLTVFLAQTNQQEHLVVSFNQQAENEQESENNGTPATFWGRWIIDPFVSMNWNKESNRNTLDLRYGSGMNYVTEQWRIRIDPSFFYQERFVRSNEQEITFVRRTNSFSLNVVKSLTDHWSVGLSNSFSENTYANIKLSMWLGGAVEYSIFPYADAVTKEFTIAYRLGGTNYRYLEETIFLETHEQLLRHSLNVNFRLRQRWGDVNVELSGANFMPDWSKNRLNFDARMGVRVIKGLTMSVGGSYDLINDQISLPRGDATLEEILLGQRQLATSFEMGLNFGLRYTFGALYNNIVNTRL